ncbi:MAG: formylglycine-generating enzyme family protein [Deltaproteobacteria bacterium]|nr:formylglycine-generating enzyme family protein [Deltaproteobacteria bacterium]
MEATGKSKTPALSSGRTWLIGISAGLALLALIAELRATTPPQTLTNSVGMKFVLIPAGTFQMGSEKGESGRLDNEEQHQVTISRPFYLQTTEVTQGQWQQVMGHNPAKFNQNGDDSPVERVSWDDAQAFLAKLNQMEKTGQYRLPTEAEWEYACRAGGAARFSFGNDGAKLGEYAWYDQNSGGRTHPVGQLKPNAWGLYDMHGNVWEWCQDWYGEYAAGPVTDPRGPSSGRFRVLRGGSWYLASQAFFRCAHRHRDRPTLRSDLVGFRVARDPS